MCAGFTLVFLFSFFLCSLRHSLRKAETTQRPIHSFVLSFIHSFCLYTCIKLLLACSGSQRQRLYQPAVWTQHGKHLLFRKSKNKIYQFWSHRLKRVFNLSICVHRQVPKVYNRNSTEIHPRILECTLPSRVATGFTHWMFTCHPFICLGNIRCVPSMCFPERKRYKGEWNQVLSSESSTGNPKVLKRIAHLVCQVFW